MAILCVKIINNVRLQNLIQITSWPSWGLRSWLLFSLIGLKKVDQVQPSTQLIENGSFSAFRVVTLVRF